MPNPHYPLAAILLACLLPLPYEYYQFVRWAAMVGFALLAYHYYGEDQTKIAIVFIGLALLYQPNRYHYIDHIPALGRAGWNMVDVVVAIWLVWLARRGTALK